MKRFSLLFLALIIVMTGMCPALAGGVSGQQNPKDVYEDAKVNFDTGMVFLKSNDPDEAALAQVFFQSAKELFEGIASYSDSIYWQYYCTGLIAILEATDLQEQGYLTQAADKIQEAVQSFQLLASVKFEDSENVLKYCSARLSLLRGLKQSALEAFKELLGTLDSDKYYFRLVTGNSPLPTQAPVTDLPPVMKVYAAHTNGKIVAYAGPGSSYGKIASLSIEKNTPVRVCAQDGYYCLAEIDTDKGIVRFWAMDVRIERDEGKNEPLPEIPQKAKTKTLIKDAETFRGPGKGFAGTGQKLRKGTRVSVFVEEDAYTLVEYTDTVSNQQFRVWIATDCLGW